MELIQFYREQFAQSIDEFEPDWQEDLNYSLGFRWDRQMNQYHEVFRITNYLDRNPNLIYALVLPERFKERNIADLIREFQSKYEIALTYFKHGIILSVCTNTEKMTETVIGFLFRARSELVDLIEFSVIRTEN
ncbi:hypothetical protein [Paenibacillus cremeus]|uniref:Uncharacterized protein n=1 Tax=Paenibacillus cremeus TaxID=2163881 RepID=A0A559KD76_9BACL|nr:hypothetical protein [Paenibacillus cremeus]TVY10049.1 hypothetical protein FPZ49_10000 [Paenibacillus cremeus]